MEKTIRKGVIVKYISCNKDFIDAYGIYILKYGKKKADLHTLNH